MKITPNCTIEMAIKSGYTELSMTDEQWDFFCRFKTEFKDFCEKHPFNSDVLLTELQKQIATENNVPPYPLETNVVYNGDLEKLTRESCVKIILVADNPGKNEQRAENRRYLIGQAGKLAEKFFRENSELQVDFRQNVIILNKSPLHTAKTALLKKLLRKFEQKTGSKRLEQFFIDSQIFMAKAAFDLQQVFKAKLFIVGYGELGAKKIFEAYWSTLKENYKNCDEDVWCFQHFSMNRFSIDLKQNYCDEYSLQENLQMLGTKHRKEIFGQTET